MYNKYIINRLLLWDSLHRVFFLLFILCLYDGGVSRDFPLWGVLIFLCTAAPEIHPPQVVPICYPVVGTRSDTFAVCRRVSAHRTWAETRKGGKKAWVEERKTAWVKLVFLRVRSAWEKLKTSLCWDLKFDFSFLHRDALIFKVRDMNQILTLCETLAEQTFNTRQTY